MSAANDLIILLWKIGLQTGPILTHCNGILEDTKNYGVHFPFHGFAFELSLPFHFCFVKKNISSNAHAMLFWEVFTAFISSLMR